MPSIVSFQLRKCAIGANRACVILEAGDLATGRMTAFKMFEETMTTTPIAWNNETTDPQTAYFGTVAYFGAVVDYGRRSISLSDGRILQVWLERSPSDPLSNNDPVFIVGQFMDTGLMPVDAPFVLNEFPMVSLSVYMNGSQTLNYRSGDLDVAADSNGGFIIAYQDAGDGPGGSTFDNGIRYVAYDSQGQLQHSGVVSEGVGSVDLPFGPSVSVESDGTFLVTYTQNTGNFGASETRSVKYSANGSVLVPSVETGSRSEQATNDGKNAFAGYLSNGNLLVVNEDWSGTLTASRLNLRVQTDPAPGQPPSVITDFFVDNLQEVGYISDLAIGPNGFALAYVVRNPYFGFPFDDSVNGYDYEIWVRFYDNAAVEQSALLLDDFRIGEYPNNFIRVPLQVAALDTGEFVVSYYFDLQRYSATGTEIGTPVSLGSRISDLETLNDGRVVAHLYTLSGPFTQTISGYGQVIYDTRDDQTTILGTNGNDQLAATPYGDTVSPGGGADTVYGSFGNDLFLDADGASGDLFDGAGGKDKLDVSSAPQFGVPVHVNLDLAAGIMDSGNGTPDKLRNIEDFQGSVNDEIITASGVASIIHGGNGNDTFRPATAAGTSTVFNGGNGIDTFDLSTLDSFFDLPEVSLILGYFRTSPYTEDQLISIENVIGSETTDTITGSDGDNVLYGNGFGDFLYGRNGNDTLYGGADNDTLDGGRNDDMLYGNRGDDIMRGGSGQDFFDGGIGIDTIDYSANAAQSEIHLPNGTATFNGTFVENFIRVERFLLGSGDDVFNISTPRGVSLDNRYTFDGGVGKDGILATGDAGSLFSVADVNLVSIERLTIGAGNTLEIKASQIASGTITPDFILEGVGSGNYRLFLQGDQTVVDLAGISIGNWGVNGTIELEQKAGIPLSFHGAADSRHVVTGSSGNDEIGGGAFSDTLEGGEGHDDLFGFGGADLLLGGAGEDEIRGGASGDTIHGGGDNDTLYGDAGEDEIHGEGGNDTIYGGGDRDIIDGGSGENFLFGNLGKDFFIAGIGVDHFNGGGDFDRVSYAYATDSVAVDLEKGLGFGNIANDDTFAAVENATGSAFKDELFGNDLANSLRGGGGDDTIRGGNGRDTLEGQAGDDTIFGGDSHDSVLGGADNDVLFGDAGLDKLFGGTGDDEMTGGADTDYFVFEGDAAGFGQDIIRDFQDGIDKLQFKDVFSISNPANVADDFSDFTVEVSAAYGVKIRFEAGQVIYLDDTLNGITVADIDESDFVFL